MRPPRCDVCGEAAESDGLITCLTAPDDAQWYQRATQPGFVGHPPHLGWFCPAHATDARELASTHHRGEVVRILRGEGARPTPRPQASPEIFQEFDWPGSLHDLYRALRDAFPAVVAHVGLDVSSIGKRTKRDWHPMDGSRPPDCPFVETVVHEASEGDVRVELEFEVAYWNESQAARSSVRVDVVRAGEHLLKVSGWSPASGAPYDVEQTRVKGDLPDALAASLERVRRAGEHRAGQRGT